MGNHRLRGTRMKLRRAHRFSSLFGWTRFTGFGYFAMERLWTL